MNYPAQAARHCLHHNRESMTQETYKSTINPAPHHQNRKTVALLHRKSGQIQSAGKVQNQSHFLGKR